MKKLFLILATLFFTQGAAAWTVVPVPGTFTAMWTDANGVARSSPASASGEVYVGGVGKFVIHNVATVEDSMAARFGSVGFYACYSALEYCLAVDRKHDAEGTMKGSGPNGVLDFSLSMPTAQSSATLNVAYALRQSIMGVIISAKTVLTAYAYPTDADLNRLFAYAKSFPAFAGGAGSVQSITIAQGKTGAGTYKYILSGDKQWAVGVNADDGKVWLYGPGMLQAYTTWWAALKEAQGKGF